MLTHTLRVRYKSGAYEEFDVAEYTFKAMVNGGRSLEWTLARGSRKPVFLNWDEVESIWEVKVRRPWWRLW